MVAIKVHGFWHAFRQAGSRDGTRPGRRSSHRAFRSVKLELLETRTLLSLGGAPGPLAVGAASTIRSVSAPAGLVSLPSLDASVSGSASISMTFPTPSEQASIGPPAPPHDAGPVGQPSILIFDQDGNTLSSLDGAMLDSPLSGAASTIPVGTGPTPPDQATVDAEAKELTPEGLASLPMLPWSFNSSFHGTLTSDHAWSSFTVPVGPSTNILRLAVHPENSADGSSAAVVDQVYLIGADGSVVASLVGAAAFSSGSRQALSVTLNWAPKGGLLLVRVVNPACGTNPLPVDEDSTDAAEATDTTSPTDSGDGTGAIPPLPFIPPSIFEVDVQRQDPPQTSSAETWLPSPQIPAPGSYPPLWPDLSQGRVSVPPASAAATITTVSYDPVDSTTTKLANTSAAKTSTGPPDLEPETSSISLGPLVSRGSAPIGPALATSIDDPAPLIGRGGEGDGTPEQDQLDDEGFELVLRRDRGDVPEAAARGLDPEDVLRSDDEDSPLTSLKGLGGLPLLVSSYHRARGPEHAQELAATLAETADAAAARVDESAPPTTAEGQDRRDGRVARAGIVTRAVGFIVALGLASGPLYPDLVALARRRFARKRSVVLLQASKSGRRRIS